MNALILLACLAFLASTIWSAIQRAWPLCLLALGAFLYTVQTSGIL